MFEWKGASRRRTFFSFTYTNSSKLSLLNEMNPLNCLI